MIDARTIFITVTILVVLSLTTVFAKSGGGYTPLVVEAVNAQQAQIEDLKTQLASMQSIIKQLLAQQSTDTRRATEDSQGANP